MLRSLVRVTLVVSAMLVATTAPVVHTVVAAWRYAASAFCSGLENLHQAPCGEIATRPTVERVKAHAFVARLLKRERPRVTTGWRMCPST